MKDLFEITQLIMQKSGRASEIIPLLGNKKKTIGKYCFVDPLNKKFKDISILHENDKIHSVGILLESEIGLEMVENYLKMKGKRLENFHDEESYFKFPLENGCVLLFIIPAETVGDSEFSFLFKEIKIQCSNLIS